MAMCIQKLVSRFSPINTFLIQGRHLTNLQIQESHPHPQLITTLATNENGNYVKNILSPQATLNSPIAQSLQPNYNHLLLSNNLASDNKVNASAADNPNPSESGSQGPSEEQLAKVFENLKENLPLLFVTTLDYTICHPKIIFENNIQGKTTVGLFPYVKTVSTLRVVGHMKYAYVKLEIMKMTKHIEDGSIRIRWRVSGINGWKLFLKFWKFRWNIKESLKQQEIWLDGFSIMYVGSDGLIQRHIADKVIPDQGHETNIATEIVDKLTGASKVALFVGLSSDISPMIMG